MNIIVTGGAGFIGSNVVDAYIKAGHRVSVIDNLHHGFKHNLNRRAKFFQADICDLAAMRRIVAKVKPAVINHHAAIAEVISSVRNPLPTMTVNVQGTINLLLAGAEVGMKKFIFASTGGAIYGDAKQLPTTEQAPTRPVSPYGLSKLLAEECIEYYSRVYGFNHLIFRYPNVFGPRQDPKGEAGVVAIFAQHLHQNKAVTIFGDGTKTRDYMYVRDIVRANMLALRKGLRLTMNLGTGKAISDQRVFDTLHRYFPQSPTVRYKAVRAGEVIHSCLNSRFAQQSLGWKSGWTFTSGIQDYLEQLRYV